MQIYIRHVGFLVGFRFGGNKKPRIGQGRPARTRSALLFVLGPLTGPRQKHAPASAREARSPFLLFVSRAFSAAVRAGKTSSILFSSSLGAPLLCFVRALDYFFARALLFSFLLHRVTLKVPLIRIGASSKNIWCAVNIGFLSVVL